MIQSKVEQVHNVNIEDYANRLKVNKKVFFNEFIAP